MNEENMLGIQLSEGENFTDETLVELSNGKGDDENE